MKKIIIILSVLLPILSYATGGSEGTGGGDTRCAEYIDLARSISNELASITSKKTVSPRQEFNSKQITRIAKKLRCIPKMIEDRQAISYPKDIITELDVEQWDDIAQKFDKIRLVAHELSVIAGYEGDGQYQQSNMIIEFLKNNSKILEENLKAESVIHNSDGTVFFINPFFFHNGTQYRYAEAFDAPTRDKALQVHKDIADGICRSLGRSEWAKSIGDDTYDSLFNSDHKPLIWVDKRGIPVSLDNDPFGTVFGYVETLLCR